jgi:hypothetical protein
MRPRPVRLVFTGLAGLAILLGAPLGAQNGGTTLAPQFEPSYVVAGPWSRHHPDTTLLFEANIAPPFYIALTPRWALVLTPKVILRQFAEGSQPVKTPSYMPRAAFYRWWARDEDAEFLSLMFSHHSNGQGGDHRDPVTGRLNHENGNFSTNFFDLTYQRSVRVRGVESTLRGSIEWHIPGMYDPDEMRDYSKLRIYGSTGIAVSRPKTGKNEWTAGAMLGYLAGDVAPRFEGLDRFQLWLTLGWAPSRRSDLSVFANYFNGQDYYNNYYDQRLSVFRIGFATNRDRAEAEIPQQPVF